MPERDAGLAVCVTVLFGVFEPVTVAVAVPVFEGVAPTEMVAVLVAVGDAAGTQAVSVTEPAVPAAPDTAEEARGAKEPATSDTPALALIQELPPPPPL